MLSEKTIQNLNKTAKYHEEREAAFPQSGLSLMQHLARQREKAAAERARAATAFGSKAIGWRAIRQIDVFCSDTKGLGGAISALKSKDDQLYIRGHCSEGAKELTSSDRKKTVDVDTLADALKELGLSPQFEGRIKIFACVSGVDRDTQKSFAYRFAESLTSRGYIRLQVIGYTEKLYTFIVDDKGYKLTETGARAKTAQVPIVVRSPASCVIM
jgi:hypothetical protein